MTIIKSTVIDQVTVIENGTILYREVTRISDGDVQISQTFHRTSLVPGHDLAGQPANVAAIAQAAWTSDVVAAYQAEQERIAGEMAARMAKQQPAVQG